MASVSGFGIEKSSTKGMKTLEDVSIRPARLHGFESFDHLLLHESIDSAEILAANIHLLTPRA